MNKKFHQSQINYSSTYGGLLGLICFGFLHFGWLAYLLGIPLAVIRFKNDHVFRFLLKHHSKSLINVLAATTILTLVAPVISFYASNPLVAFISELLILVGALVVAIIVSRIHSEKILLNHGWVKI